MAVINSYMYVTYNLFGMEISARWPKAVSQDFFNCRKNYEKAVGKFLQRLEKFANSFCYHYQVLFTYAVICSEF